MDYLECFLLNIYNEIEPLVYFFAALLTSCLKDDDAIVKPLYTNNPLQTELDKWANNILEQYARIPSAGSVRVGIYKGGEEHYYGYGELEIGTGIIPDSLTIYEISSITKTYTALMAIDYLHTNDFLFTQWRYRRFFQFNFYRQESKRGISVVV